MNAPNIARDLWEKHPHFPAQTLLLGSHSNFLRVSEHLVHELAGGAHIESVGLLYRRWIAAMRSHESYEETKLYPFLARRWRCSFEDAVEGHRALHAAHDDVIEALEDRDRHALTLALDQHHEVLVSHLEKEEDLVIPLLLELSPSEFNAYAHSNIGALMQNLKERGY